MGEDSLKTSCDVLVVGGGIYGAGIAWDAALRGLRTILIDKGDFGAATSAGCFKILHGGLRYLQHLDFNRLKRSVEEQRLLRILAPNHLRPLPILVPCYGRGARGKGFLRLGILLYELLSGDRNKGVFQDQRLPRHRVLSRAEVLAEAPGTFTKGLTGGVLFYDAQIQSCERLTLAVVQSAKKAGAEVRNYTALESVEFDATPSEKPLIKIARIRELRNNKTSDIRPRCIVNATGPWIQSTLQKIFGPSSLENLSLNFFSRGWQVVLDQVVCNTGLAIQGREVDIDSKLSRGSRSYFLTPWRNGSLLGTTDDAYSGDPEDFRVSPAEVDAFLREVRESYNSPAFDRAHVCSIFGGLVPAESVDNSSKHRITKEDLVIDHASGERSNACQNLFSVAGAKYTTFRHVSENVVDLLCRRLGHDFSGKPTRSTKLHGSDYDSLDLLVREARDKISPKVSGDNELRELVQIYGTEFRNLLAYVPLDLEDSVLSALQVAQIRYAIDCEFAHSLGDILGRRLEMTAFGLPPPLVVERVAEVMAEKCSWTSADVENEKARFYSELNWRYLKEI